MTSHNTTVEEETVQVNAEDDRRRKDAEKRSRDVVTSDSLTTKNVHEQSTIGGGDMEERSFVQTDVITTETTTSKSFGEKNETDRWSQRIRDEPDSTFHKDQTAGDTHSSMSEESWTMRSGRSTHRDTSTMIRSHDRTGAISPSTLQGGMRCQTVDSEQLDICTHEEKRRFYIRAIIDPRNGLHLSVREVVTCGNIETNTVN